jgi:hypothetical protein
MSTRLSFEFVIGRKVTQSESGTWGSPVTRLKRYTQWICNGAERQLFVGPEDMELRTDLCPISHRSRIHEPPSIPFLQVQNKKKNYTRHDPHSLTMSPRDRRKWSAATATPKISVQLQVFCRRVLVRETVAGAAANGKETI